MTVKCLQIREANQLKHMDINEESQKEFLKLQEVKQNLQEKVEVCRVFFFVKSAVFLDCKIEILSLCPNCRV